ncbi:MAG: putative transposase for insertion sequence element [Bacteroidetes bacterium]|nr:putative transposase for insertion sequence element [Bacteroidota bacterium]
MRLTMRERRAVVNATAKRYQHASKKGRGVILDEFTHTTGYTRTYAARVLAHWLRKKVLTIGGVRTIYVLGLKKSKPKGKNAPKRPATYGSDIVRLLKILWAMAGGLCGKRLAPFIRDVVPVLERFEELPGLTREQRKKLLAVSPATIDRLLAPERAKYQLKGRSTTRPGSLLKHQIPIRTYSDWDENKPGFLEADLVAQDGGIPASNVIHSLTLTDVASGWTEVRALRSKARRWVLEALKEMRSGLPFEILGLDSDNGSEFINEELFLYCQDQHLTFTRSRSQRKNDSCFVEQKNYSVVRQAIGYARMDTEKQLACLKELYRPLCLLTNYFLPSAKLLSKTRDGAHVTKKHDEPKTPYQRLLNHEAVDPNVKAHLKRRRRSLNPADLRRQISSCQERLTKMTETKAQTTLRKKRKHLDAIY